MTAPPRVALFPSAFHPHIGGVEELTRQLGLELSRRGTPPLILTNRWPTDLPRRDVVDGLEVVRERFSVPERHWRPRAGYLLHARATRRRLHRAVTASGAQLLHVQCVSSNGWYALAEKRRTGLPLVVTLQGELSMDATQVYQRSAMLRSLWRELLDAADVVTACSAYVLQEAQRAYGASFGSRGRVIANGVMTADVASGPAWQHPRPYICAVGRLVVQKGFDVLIRAFALIAAHTGDLDLLVAGGGSVAGDLRELVDEMGLSGRVHLVGPQPHEQVLALYRGAAAFVLSSRHEPQGIVVLEAMAAGCPVLAADVGGVSETVDDGVNGLLFRGGDAVDLATKFGQLLADEASTRTRAVAAEATAAAHDWSAVTDSYLQAYSQAGCS